MRIPDKIIELRYDWSPATYNGYENVDEHYQTATVGIDGVLEIYQHAAAGEGDKWYYDICYENTTIRTFNPNRVIFENKEI